jgi:hypothetical protein
MEVRWLRKQEVTQIINQIKTEVEECRRGRRREERTAMNEVLDDFF